MVNGSLLTAALRLRAAHRELVAQRQHKQEPVDAVEQPAEARQQLAGVAA